MDFVCVLVSAAFFQITIFDLTPVFALAGGPVSVIFVETVFLKMLANVKTHVCLPVFYIVSKNKQNTNFSEIHGFSTNSRNHSFRLSLFWFAVAVGVDSWAMCFLEQIHNYCIVKIQLNTLTLWPNG